MDITSEYIFFFDTLTNDIETNPGAWDHVHVPLASVSPDVARYLIQHTIHKTGFEKNAQFRVSEIKGDAW
jgi:hypothetical protein